MITHGGGFPGIGSHKIHDCSPFMLPKAQRRDVFGFGYHKYQPGLGAVLHSQSVEDLIFKNLTDCGMPDLQPDSCLLRWGDAELDPAVFDITVAHGTTWDNVTCANGGLIDVVGMVSAAIAILQNNFDIVRWLACALEPDLSDCLQDYLFDSPGSGTKHLEVELHDDDQFQAFQTDEPGRNCRIKMEMSALCAYYVNPVNEGRGSLPEDCALVDLAATILHELVHCCGREIDHDDTPTCRGNHCDGDHECNKSYELENAFRWAMAQRFPDIVSSDGCGYYDDPALLFSDNLSYPRTSS